MIKIIATDFDWTLIDHSGKGFLINRELKAYFDRFITRGNFAGIVSGRIFHEMVDIVNRMGYEWGNPYPNFAIYKEVYITDLQCGKQNEHAKNQETRARILAAVRTGARHLDEWLSAVEQAGVFMTEWHAVGDSGISIYFNGIPDAQKAEHIIRERARKAGLAAVCRVFRNAKIVIIAAAGLDKGTALLEFIKGKGIAPNEVLAIGDSYNDLPMIDGTHGFIGGCVGNAEEELKHIVLSRGGYVGTGSASDSVLDILKMAQRDALLPVFDVKL